MSSTGLSLHEILAELEAEEDDVGADRIYIQPPIPSHDSDEDSGEEDGGGDVNNLAPRLLQAEAEVVLTNQSRIGLQGDGANLKKVNKGSNKPARTKSNVYIDWQNEDLREWHSLFPHSSFTNYRNLTPYDMFELF